MASDKALHTVDETNKSSGIAGFTAGIARSLTRALAGISRGSIAGTIAGISEEAAGYPLDIVKTRMQVVANHGGAIAVIKDIIKQDGVSGLFKGLTPPVAAAAFVNATLFGAYDTVLSRFAKASPVSPSHSEQKAHSHEEGSAYAAGLPAYKIFIAGSAGGLAQAFITCPIDVVKNRMQVHGLHHPEGTHDGPITIAKKVFTKRGIPGMYTGMGATLLRDIPGYGFFFATYETLKKSLGSSSEEGPGMLSVVVAGGVSGMVYHASTYPVDVVKSILQTQSMEKPMYNGMVDCFRKVYATYGLKGLFNGFAPTCIRAFPANAAGFIAYELALKFLPAEKSS